MNDGTEVSLTDGKRLSRDYVVVTSCICYDKAAKVFFLSVCAGGAGMTFPMSIGIVAANNMSAYFEGIGRGSLAAFTAQLGGIQIYITTMIVGFVLLNFLIMALKIERR